MTINSLQVFSLHFSSSVPLQRTIGQNAPTYQRPCVDWSVGGWGLRRRFQCSKRFCQTDSINTLSLTPPTGGRSPHLTLTLPPCVDGAHCLCTGRSRNALWVRPFRRLRGLRQKVEKFSTFQAATDPSANQIAGYANTLHATTGSILQ